LIKDALMIGALTLSIIVCLYLYTKHRRSLDQIKMMMIEFDKLTTSTESDVTTLNRGYVNAGNDCPTPLTTTSVGQAIHSSTSSLFLFRRKQTNESDQNDSSNLYSQQKRENKLIIEKNVKLLRELNIAKDEAERLRKARENADGQMVQLRLAEQELEKVRAALKQSEIRLDMVKYQPPTQLIGLLNRTYESEKELLDYKFKLIEKEKEACMDSLRKVSKRQSGILGALKIAHTSTLQEINLKLEMLK
jgi:hypothetical protein